jgi:hypothetical protein
MITLTIPNVAELSVIHRALEFTHPSVENTYIITYVNGGYLMQCVYVGMAWQVVRKACIALIEEYEEIQILLVNANLADVFVVRG